MDKAVSTIVAAVTIVAIATLLTSTAYIWGVPLIQKRQEASVTEKVYNSFSQSNQNSLPKMIEDVANNRGIKTFTINTDGIWILNEDDDSIQFNFTSKTANIAANTVTPISLTPGVQCSGTAPQNSPSPSTGTLGQDSSSVVCVTATIQEELFIISYKIWFRELDDNPFSPTQGFKIDLVKDPSGLLASSGRVAKITFDDSTQQIIGEKTLITKKVKILLI